MSRFDKYAARELAIQISDVYSKLNLAIPEANGEFFICEYSLNNRFKYRNVFSPKVGKNLKNHNSLAISRSRLYKGFMIQPLAKFTDSVHLTIPSNFHKINAGDFDKIIATVPTNSEGVEIAPEQVKEDLISVLEKTAIKKENANKFYFPKFYNNIKQCVENGEHVYIYGPAGCGKTTALRMLVKEMYPQFCVDGVYPFDIDFSQGVDEATFLGTKEATVDENGRNITKFAYGIFPQAIKLGAPIIVNEIDSAPPHYLTALHSILDDDNAKLVLMDNGGEVLTPTNGFAVLATANTLGLGENQQKFAGTVQLNEAFLDRFNAFFEMSYTNKEIDIVTAILNEPSDVTPLRIMEFILDVRKSNASENIISTISTRRLKMFVKKINEWGLKTALENVVYARLDTDDRNIVKEIAQRHFVKK